MSDKSSLTPRDVLKSAQQLRAQVGVDFHEKLVESIYTDATRIADRAVTRPDKPPRFDLDRTIDKIVTSKTWGFLLMILLFTLVFWLTISGANVPSAMLATLFMDIIYPWLKGLAASRGLPLP